MGESHQGGEHPDRMKAMRAAVCAIAFLILSGTSAAQTSYPVKPIRIVIGTPAGGGSEVSARIVGQVFTQTWGQQFIVEPRPGASGNIAAEYVAKTAPDGYTLYVCYGSHTVNPSIYPRVGYEPLKDFTPVTLIATQYNALVVHP